MSRPRWKFEYFLWCGQKLVLYLQTYRSYIYKQSSHNINLRVKLLSQITHMHKKNEDMYVRFRSKEQDKYIKRNASLNILRC